MKEVLFICALEAEFDSHVLDEISPDIHFFYLPVGIGKVNSAVSLMHFLKDHQPDLIINVGTAGTFQHHVGDVVCANNYLDRDIFSGNFTLVGHRLDNTLLRPELLPQSVLSGEHVDSQHFLVSTGDNFMTEMREEEYICDAVDMESYAMAFVCQKYRIPFFSIKYITDVVGQNSQQHWEDKLHDARIGLGNFVKTIDFSVF